MFVRAVDDKPSDTLVVVPGEGFWTGSSTLPHLHQTTHADDRSAGRWLHRRMQRRTRLVTALSVAMLAATMGAPAVRAADPVIVAAGDIGDCTTTADTATAKLLDAIPGTVVTLGDNAYDSGTAAQFRDCYAPNWGRHLTRTRPSPGNHDYGTDDATGYFGYFGWRAGDPSRGYYSYDLGTWHIVVLNSNCGDIGGCGSSSPQAVWLRADLAKKSGFSVLAYWHHPRFSSGEHGDDTSVGTFWEILYAAGADLILNGHDHDYERFAPQDPGGRADPSHGIRQFVVGTGGTDLRARASTAANSQVFSSTHGVLRLTLRADAYDWAFVPIAGKTFKDSGTAATHEPPGARTTKTFAISDDTYVDQGRPGTNFGSATRILVDSDAGGGTDQHGYLKATVAGISGAVDRAMLRLWVTNPTVNGPRVHPTTTGWAGGSITWRTKPPQTGNSASDAGAMAGGRWVDLDVTKIVRGNGTYGFLLHPTSGDGLAVESRQGAHPPRLIVQTVAASGD